MKAQAFREVAEEELDHKLGELRREIFELRGQKLDSKTQKTHLIGQKRKEIAKILTIQRERQLKGNRGNNE